MPDHISVSFKCAGCGKQLLWKDDLRDEEIVTCPNCGRNGPTLGELKSATFEAAKKEVEKITGKGIKWK